MKAIRLAILTALFAAGSGLNSAAAPVTLQYWGNEVDLITSDPLRDFEATYNGTNGKPEIHVVFGQSATLNKTEDPQRLLCAVAGGDPPDVVWFDRFAVSEWAARGAFMPLDRFLDHDLREHPGDPLTLRPQAFWKPCWDESMYLGHVYGIPYDVDNRALYYNQDVFDKYAAPLIAAGCLDPEDPSKPGPPKTWEQLKAATKIMTEFDENGRLRQAGFIPNFGNSWFYMFSWLNGGEMLSPDGLTCTLASKANVDALVYVTELYDLMGGAEKVAAFTTTLQTGDLDPFISGKIAMRIDCGAFLPIIASLRRNLRFGVVEPPAPEGMPRFGWSGGFDYVIPSGCKHPEEAWLLIKHMLSQRAYKLMCDAALQSARTLGGVYVPYLSGREDVSRWGLEHYLYSDPTVEETFKHGMRTIAGGVNTSKFRPVTPVGQILWNEQVRGMEMGIYHRYDPDIRHNAELSLQTGQKIVQISLDKVYAEKAAPEVAWWPVILGYLFLVLAAVAALAVWFQHVVTAKDYHRQEYYAGYFFAAPWFLGFVVFGGGPLLFSLVMSLCEYDVFSPPRFIGLQNYREMFTADPLFYKSLWNTLYMALGIPLGMILSLGIALLLSAETRGMAAYRTFFYLPAIMPAVAASILWIWIFNPTEGILNSTLAHLGVAGPAWLQNQYWAKPALILMGLWGAGGGMIVWLAGLKGIPSQLYEAAELDGAGKLRQFFSITLPMLSPYILFNLIMGLIGAFQTFTQAYVMTRGGPVDSTLFYAFHLFNNAFRYMRMGYASALAWVLFAIILVLTLIQLWSSKRWVYYESDR